MRKKILFAAAVTAVMMMASLMSRKRWLMTASAAEKQIRDADAEIERGRRIC